MFGGKWMDTFMDKLAQKLNAQEMIKANSAADAEEMDQLKNQLREYDECLAQMQQEDGAFLSWGAESSESVSQVLVALTALGLSPDDARFVKNGQTLEEVLLRFAQNDGSFVHTQGDGGNLLATTQAFYALAAVQRARDGKTSLYDMSDVAP